MALTKPKSGQLASDTAVLETSLGTLTFVDDGVGNLTILNSDGSTLTVVSNSVTATDVTNIVQLTQAEYDALGTPDSTTLYIIVG